MGRMVSSKTGKPMSKRTPEQQDAWAHNGLTGSCWMARCNAKRVMDSRTATQKAKLIAGEIYTLTFRLADALKDRR